MYFIYYFYVIVHFWCNGFTGTLAGVIAFSWARHFTDSASLHPDAHVQMGTSEFETRISSGGMGHLTQRKLHLFYVIRYVFVNGFLGTELFSTYEVMRHL